MPHKYRRVLALVQDMPIAMLPTKIEAVRELLVAQANGEKFSPEEIAARIGAGPRQGARSGGAVAVLPLYGVVAQRMSMMRQVSEGGASTTQFAAQFRQAMSDPNIKAVVIDVDSPGGGVYGVAELGAEIRDAVKAGGKPIVAVANSLAASAAYWIASQAGELVVTPGGEVGSIGVFTIHEDASRLYDAMGLDVTMISAGKYKVEGNPFEPLSDEAREAMQARVDDYYRMFVSAVAKGRGVSVSAVKGGFGQGRVVGAEEAVKLGMADRVDTLENVIRRLGGNPSAATQPMAPEPDMPGLTHEGGEPAAEIVEGVIEETETDQPGEAIQIPGAGIDEFGPVVTAEGPKPDGRANLARLRRALDLSAA